MHLHHSCFDHCEGVRVKVLMFSQQCMESKGESHNKEKTDERKLQKCLHHVGEHDDVDSKKRKFTNIGKLKVS